MKIVMWVHVPAYREAVLARIKDAPGVELVVVHSGSELASSLTGADAMISAGASIYTPEVERAIRDTPTLRWFQSVSAGNDNLDELGIREGIVVTGSGGHSGPVVAEHAIALLLSIAHAIPDWERGRLAQQWKIARTGSYKSLYGGVACVIGLGHIGGEIARRLKGLGITSLGVSRSGASHEHVDRAYAMSDMAAALARSDAVIVAVPLSVETRGLMGRSQFSACKKGAFFVNIARGGIVDQTALANALASGQLGGAAIDVAEPEPLPKGHPLWACPNLIISPHVAGGGSTASPQRLAEVVGKNLDSFISGKPLVHVLPFGGPRAHRSPSGAAAAAAAAAD